MAITPAGVPVTRDDRGRVADSVATGFPSLDRLLGGGVRGGDLVALGGDVGSGRSALALAMAVRRAKRGEPAIVLSSEMRPERLRERVLAMEARVSLDELRLGNVPPERREELRELSEWLEGGGPGLQVLAPGAGAHLATQAIRAAPGGSLVVVDFLEALAANERSLADELAAIVRALKAAALDATCAVLMVTSSSAAAERNPASRPALRDFGAGGAVGQMSDVVAALYREEMYDSSRGVEGAAELHLLKNRHGGTGYVDLYYYKHWLRFEDMLEE